MQEYNTHTHTHTHVHMDILLLTAVFASMEAPAPSSNLITSVRPFWAANRSEVLLFWWKYYKYGKYDIRHYYQYHTMQYYTLIHNITLSNTISNYSIHHIKSSNIIKWLTVIQTKRERITKRKSNRLREWTDWESDRKK